MTPLLKFKKKEFKFEHMKANLRAKKATLSKNDAKGESEPKLEQKSNVAESRLRINPNGSVTEFNTVMNNVTPVNAQLLRFPKLGQKEINEAIS